MEVPLMGKHSSIDATKNIDQIKSCLPLQTIKIARGSQGRNRRKIEQVALGKVNRGKEI